MCDDLINIYNILDTNNQILYFAKLKLLKYVQSYKNKNLLMITS